MDTVAGMYTLVLLRHGQSVWNERNLFTGWVDVDLTARGEDEARRGGDLLAAAGVLPDVVHTSLQRRAIRTANLALERCDRLWIPTHRHWRLNERHYGALTGLDKRSVAAQHGDAQLQLWRRSYDTPPPPMDPDNEYWPGNDPRYQLLAPDVIPATECLADVVARFLPYWEDHIVPDLRRQRVVLVAAHGNSLRALIKHLDRLSPDEVAELNIPTGIPLVYALDELLAPIVPPDHRSGEPKARYLDPEAARAGAAAVAAQSGRRR